MADRNFDCVVIGSGPGGYVAAIRAAQLGLKTAVVEKDAPGGICLNWGCIPTKALLKSAELYQSMCHAQTYGLSASEVSFDMGAIVDRSRRVVDKMSKGINFLLTKNSIEYIQGLAEIKGPRLLQVSKQKGEKETIDFEKLIIATGARPRNFTSLPVDEERIINSRHALALRELPSRLLVIGAGAIGVEFAYFFSSFGTEVTLVEMLDRILPLEDQEVSQGLANSLRRNNKIKIHTSAKVSSMRRVGETVEAEIEAGGVKTNWSGDYALVAVGMQGNVERLGLENVGIIPQKNFIPVNDYLQTSAPNIYAIGDVIGTPLLAHVASHQGIIAAEHSAGVSTHPLDYNTIPACTYCQPQVASVGLTESKAKESGYTVKVGKFPFAAIGKAVASGEGDGFVKVVIDSQSEEILGVHILHAHASELIAEGTIAKALEATATSVFNTVHPHPTLSEGLMEAMGLALGRAIHL